MILAKKSEITWQNPTETGHRSTLSAGLLTDVAISEWEAECGTTANVTGTVSDA